MSPRSTTLPWYFCIFSNSTFLMFINEAKWTFFLSLWASRITSFLLLTFSKFHAWVLSSFSVPCPQQIWRRESSSHAVQEWTCAPDCNVSWKQILFLQCDVHDLLIAKILTLTWILCCYQFSTPYSVAWDLKCCLSILLHSMAGATGLSSFLLAFWEFLNIPYHQDQQSR